jgi:prepilin-type N-terminal cleavage/methylation domain-containing protein
MIFISFPKAASVFLSRALPPANPGGPRCGFTITELLVVIGIIGGLLALLIPTVRGAIRTARAAAIKNEIDMLHMAIMNYKNEFGSYPPARGVVMGLAAGKQPQVVHLRRLFPRCADPSVSGQQFDGVAVTPVNALWCWLNGYTGDPESPLDPAVDRKRLYDFDETRVNRTSTAYIAPHTLGSPYLYFDSGRYGVIDNVASGIVPATYFVWRADAEFTRKVRDYVANPNATTLSALQTNSVLHHDTFQIISAGLDGEFYTDDDLSNMWPGTWGEWKERVASGAI